MNRMPRRMFESVRNETTEDWRKFRNEEHSNFSLSLIIIKMIIQED
jgi:hypothetical protein